MNTQLTTILTLTICFCQVHSSNDWSIKVPYYEHVNLSCGYNETSIFDNSSEIMWVLPDGYLVKINTTKTDYGRYHFAKFGNLLDIEKLDDEDFGIYVCIVKSPDGSILAFKKGINVDGPYYGDLLEKYRSYAITGAIAASVMFVFASVFCFICHRQQAKGQDSMDEWRKAHPGKIWQSNEVEHVYDNKALESDVALEKRGTEMSEVVADYHLKEEKNGRPDLNTKL